MPSHEEGEFELVLGNKQLLSVFFLVILLLGVFFSMGYIVGRNTAPATSLSASSRQPPIVVDPIGGGSTSPLPVRPPAADRYKPSPLAADPPKPAAITKADPPKATEPVKSEPPKVEPPKLVPMVKADPPKVVEPAKPKPEPVKPPKVEPPKVTAVVTKGGTFLQVVATKQPEASQVVASLTAKGFPASLSPVPDSKLLRVIVGPLADAAAVSKTRDGLQAAGYQPIIRKF